MPLVNLTVLIAQLFFNFFSFALIIRFLLQLVKADFYNPWSQWFIKLTNPVLNPLRKLIPGNSKIDFASLIAALFFKIILIYLIAYKTTLTSFSFYSVSINALYSVCDQILSIYLYCFIILAIASWIVPHSSHPALSIMFQIIEPITYKVRRFIPPIGGIDLSYMVIVFAIIAIQKYILPSLFNFF